ncbi:amidophosphoribosyltransferase [Candidatus Uhrbacteria bacterium]|nr:amidophosphoribosyltransferase [Candidatus Uhrbacteria bacterium]
MCDLGAAIGVPDAAAVTVAAGQARSNHRGQDAAKVVSVDGETFHEHGGIGLIGRVFEGMNISEVLPGDAALLHLRYSTTGAAASTDNIQPFRRVLRRHGEVAAAHNGNLTNYESVAARLSEKGCRLKSTTDSEVFLPLIEEADTDDMFAAITYMAGRVEGAYALVVLTREAMYLVRDPFGFRPLFYAPCGQGWIAASETNALDMIRTAPWCEVPAGTIVRCGRDGISVSGYAFARRGGREIGVEDVILRKCFFEKYYFMRPDSWWDESIYLFRKRVGAAMGEKYRNRGVTGDIVVPVLDSAAPYAIGLAAAIGAPLEPGLVRNHYFEGRNFILPDSLARQRGVDMKYGIAPEVFQGKAVILVDDSIVRADTLVPIIKMIRAAGAVSVIAMIPCPRIINPCSYGINMKTKGELVAAFLTDEEIARKINAERVIYGEVPDMLELLGDPRGRSHCITCVTGEHPTDGAEVIYRIGHRNDAAAGS